MTCNRSGVFFQMAVVVMTGARGHREGEEGSRVGHGDRGEGAQDVREVHLAMKLKRKCNAIQGK